MTSLPHRGQSRREGRLISHTSASTTKPTNQIIPMNVTPIPAPIVVPAWQRVSSSPDRPAGGLEPKAPRTVELYGSIIRVHLKPRLGRIVLTRLTRDQLARALVEIGQALAPSSLSRVYVVLGAALDEAVRSDRIRQNVLRKLPPPPSNAASGRPGPSTRSTPSSTRLPGIGTRRSMRSRSRRGFARASCSASAGPTSTRPRASSASCVNGLARARSPT